jgi:hypothetical protein
MKNKYNERKNEVIESLRTKGVQISVIPTIHGETVHVVNVEKAKDLGNKSWGKIDFLTRNGKGNVIGLRDYSANQDVVIEKKPIRMQSANVMMNADMAATYLSRKTKHIDYNLPLFLKEVV